MNENNQKRNTLIISIALLLLLLFSLCFAGLMSTYNDSVDPEDYDTDPPAINEEDINDDVPEVIENDESGEIVEDIAFNAPDNVCSTFSLIYNSDWTLYDSVNNSNYFIEKDLYIDNTSGLGSYSLALTKGNDILYFQILRVEDNDTSQAGGIFISDSDFEEFKSNHDYIKIDNKDFYLNRDSYSLSLFLNPSREAGIWLFPGLTEYIEDGLTNNMGTVYDKYNDVFKRGNCKYFVTKFNTVNEKSEQTDQVVQDEVMEILESITW